MRNLDENKQVLFLSLSGIGNLILQLPTIQALKMAHPTWHITVWVAPRGTREIAETQDYIDHVIQMPIRAGIWQHFKNILTLRKYRFNIGIVLSPGQLIKSALYLKLAGIPMRIGNSYPYKGNLNATNFLTHAVDEQEHLHDIEQNLRVLEPLDIHPDPVSHYSLQIPRRNIEEASNFLFSEVRTPSASPLFKGEKSDYVGIHAGCAKGFEFKQWPLERFAEVAKALLQKNSNIQFLIFGGKDEEVQKQKLVKMIGLDHAEAISTSLLTTAAIIKHCKLMISNDSGLMHAAAAVGTPTLGIFGPTDEALTGPRGPKSFTVRANGTKPVYSTEKIVNLETSSHTSLLALMPQAIIDKIDQIKVF